MESWKHREARGICGYCGKRKLVKPFLTKDGRFMYWGRKGGMIRICEECRKKMVKE